MNFNALKKYFIINKNKIGIIRNKDLFEFDFIFNKIFKFGILILSILIVNLHLNHIKTLINKKFLENFLRKIFELNNFLIIIYWILLLIIAIFLIEFLSKTFAIKKIIKRKFFHFLIFFLFFPALKFMDFDLLLLISVIILYLFLLLEIMRNKFKGNFFIMEKISIYLEENIDERDDSKFIMTHTFLLFGCFSSFLFEEINSIKKENSQFIEINMRDFIGLITLGIGDAFVNFLLNKKNFN
jgi:hypothetical protein